MNPADLSPIEEAATDASVVAQALIESDAAGERLAIDDICAIKQAVCAAAAAGHLCGSDAAQALTRGLLASFKSLNAESFR